MSERPRPGTATVTTVTLARVRTADEATEMVGETVPDLTPTIHGPTIIRDADTGDLVAAYLPFTGTAPLRRLLPGMGFTAGIQRAKNYRSKSQTFGFAPRRPVFGREACALTQIAATRPEVERVLDELADQCGRTLIDLAPDIVAVDRETLGGVLPEWKLGEEKLWTSGVVNKTAQLPYHRDGFNFPTWSAMPVIRRGVSGGHLHLPEYDLVIPCADGYAVYFKGFDLVHGVTPIAKRQTDGYRYSVVFYALRGMKDCYTHAVETSRGQRKRSEREAAMAKRIAAGDTAIPGSKAARPKADRPGGIDQRTLDDMTEFASLMLSSRDVEPWADLIGALHRGGAVDREQSIWLLTLYNTHDDLQSAWASFRRWPSPQAWAAAADRDAAADYNCTQERRNLRGGKVIKRHQSYVDLLGRNTQETWMARAITSGTPGDNFASLTEHMRKVWGVGRQSAFEWAEFMNKVVDFPVDAADGQLWESSGPRRCLERIYGLTDPTPADLDAAANHARNYMISQGVRPQWVDFETIICDFNVGRDGRYYVGRHLAAIKEEILGIAGPDRDLLMDALYSFVPPEWQSIKPGIDPAKLPIYRDTGRLTRHP